MAGEDFTGPLVLKFQSNANSFRKLTGATPSKAGSPRNIGQSGPGAPRAGSRDNSAASSVAGRVPEQWQCIQLTNGSAVCLCNLSPPCRFGKQIIPIRMISQGCIKLLDFSLSPIEWR